MLQFGIDLGGTKTEIIALDSEGNERLRRRAPTPRESYPDILNTILTLVTDAASELNEPYTLGLGIPGALSYKTGLVKNANTTCLIGQDLKGDIERSLKHPVVIANDADCLALSEATDGAGAGYDSVFAVIIGTGCGGGWVVNGKVISGPNAIAGEWGHNPLSWRTDEDGDFPCYCGLTGCQETLLSGSGIRLQAQFETGLDQSAETWVKAAEAGDPQAQQVLLHHHKRLAKALAAVINLMDPHAIVLGGGASNIESIYRIVPELWGEWVFSDSVETPLLKSQYGDSSGVRGAAWLGRSAYSK
ncbi:ROK family protein [Thalassolituus sp.]|uniref:ROK family protein n=1 Tax=Thalassolituus sp. TaxID=2030822 RepID=UPI00351437D0